MCAGDTHSLLPCRRRACSSAGSLPASCDARSWLWVDRTPRLPTSTLLHRLRVATSAPTDG